MYNRAKQSMRSTAVAAGGDKVGPQNDGEKGVFAVTKKMNYRHYSNRTVDPI